MEAVQPPTGVTRRSSIRALAVAALLAVSLVAPGIAQADPFVPAALTDQANADPTARFRVVIVASRGFDAGQVQHEIADNAAVNDTYVVIPAVTATITGRKLLSLAQDDTLASITPDAPVRPSALGPTFVWPRAARVDTLWSGPPDLLTRLATPAPQAPTIAVVDSGVDADRSDFGGRVVASVNLAGGGPGAGDANGHGTLVAGLAAGASTAYPGVAQNAGIVSLRVVGPDDSALTSDVIAAADWIFENRNRYGIRVANFSLRSAAAGYGLRDPLNAAVRKLWLTGTVVVASAGNDGPQRMLYAPASDPFVITVGAVDIADSADVADDFNAPWSSFGYTAEGFAKPEVAAPGRYLTGPVPVGSTLAASFAERAVAPGYIWMSGTSFAAPIVAGAAAQILARHPDWSPDDVKGALVLTARAVPLATPLSLGSGEIDAAGAAAVVAAPNPNAGLRAFVTGTDFDADAWNAAVSVGATWTNASWTNASWTNATWTNASWTNGNDAP